MVLLALNSARAKARDAKRVASIRQLATALEMFYADNNSYPTITSGQPTYCILSSCSFAAGQSLSPKFISSIPVAPTPADNNTGATCSSPGTNDFYYNGTITTLTNGYTLSFCLGGSSGSLTAGVHTLTPGGIQ